MSSIKVHTKGYLNSDNLLPPVVVNDHKLSREEWEEKIAKFHAKHNGMSRAEAMMEYLKELVHQNFANLCIVSICCSSKKRKLQQSKLLPRWHRTLRPMASAILTSRTKKGPILFWAWIALASMCTRRRRGQRSNYIKKHKMEFIIFFPSNHIKTAHKIKFQ